MKKTHRNIIKEYGIHLLSKQDVSIFYVYSEFLRSIYSTNNEEGKKFALIQPYFLAEKERHDTLYIESEVIGENYRSDFIISKDDIRIGVVEAKVSDINQGVEQCVRAIQDLKLNFGIVTTGSEWYFMRSYNDNEIIYYNYAYIDPIEILSILDYLLTFDNSPR